MPARLPEPYPLASWRGIPQAIDKAQQGPSRALIRWRQEVAPGSRHCPEAYHHAVHVEEEKDGLNRCSLTLPRGW
jgi:hypothetical protein